MSRRGLFAFSLLVIGLTGGAGWLLQRTVSELGPQAPPPGTGRVSGRLVSSSGGPIEGATLVLRADGRIIHRLESGPNGEFEVQNIPLHPEVLAVEIRAPDHLPMILDELSIARHRTISEGVELELTAGRDVRGRVIDGRGEPVAGAQVWISHLASRHAVPFENYYTATDAQGQFLIAGAPAEELVVWAWKPSILLTSKMLRAGETEAELKTQRVSPSPIVFTVSSADGSPVPDVEIELRPYHGGLLRGGFGATRTTGADGRARFSPLPSAEYGLSLESTDLELAIEVDGELFPNVQVLRLVLRLGPGSPNAYRVREVRYRKWSGRLVTAGGRPFPRFRLAAIVHAQQESMGRTIEPYHFQKTLHTDEHGAFELVLPDLGEVPVEFSLIGNDVDLVPSRVSWPLNHRDPIELVAAERVFVSGQIRDPSGRPVPRALVLARHRPAHRAAVDLYPPVFSDESGRFSIRVPAVFDRGIRLFFKHEECGITNTEEIDPTQPVPDVMITLPGSLKDE